MTNTRPEPYVVHTATFEGPLDLLLDLAQQGQVDLQTIPLAAIAEEYLTHTRRGFDLESAAETLWMLAALVELKARSLLPQPPPAEERLLEESVSDLDALLEERLLEYRAFKDAAAALRTLEAYQRRVFLRPQAEAPDEALLTGVSLEDLFRAFNEVLERRRDTTPEIAREAITVADRIQVVVGLLEGAAGGVLFVELFRADASRLEVVVTFLAVLELIRLRRIRVTQDDSVGAIRLYLFGERGR